jgi:hypothetical protein
MLPQHGKSIFIAVLHLFFFALSIADGVRFVERKFQMSGGLDLPLQFRFGPAKLRRSVQIPTALLRCEFCLHNDHILRPANVHRLLHEFGTVPVHPVKIPHPAQIARGETGGIRITSGQVFRNGHSGSLFRPLADYPTDLAIQLHLGQFCRNSGINCSK